MDRFWALTKNRVAVDLTPPRPIAPIIPHRSASLFTAISFHFIPRCRSPDREALRHADRAPGHGVFWRPGGVVRSAGLRPGEQQNGNHNNVCSLENCLVGSHVDTWKIRPATIPRDECRDLIALRVALSTYQLNKASR
jgi:hypothetical protein